MKALVVGAGGFVGRYLMKELISRGHDTVGIDRQVSDGIHAVDILNFDQLKTFIGSANADVVFHLAASAFVNTDKVDSFYSINILGTLNVVRSCLNLQKKPWFIYISSSLVYGSGDRPFSEESALQSINHYAASKIAAEAIVQAFTNDNKLDSVILRPFNHTGVGQAEIYLIPKLVRAFRDRKPDIPMGNMDVVRDFLDVRDVVSAYASAIDSLSAVRPGEVYNICSGKEYTIRWILDTLSDITGHAPRIEQKSEFIRSNDINRSIGINKKFSKTFKWKPQFDFADTLKWMLGKNSSSN